VDDEGICVDAGVRRCPRARIAYVTPSHQYPTGVTLSLDRRIALLQWAAQNDAWIVEDDYDGEFRYEGQPLTALFSLDSRARVLYVGTLNKSMFAGLRIAYAVVPEELVEPLANIRTQLDGFAPALPQRAMSLFMDEGHFSSHLRRMRTIYGARRATLVEALAPLTTAGSTWPENPAGIHLLASHKDGEYVRAVASASGLDLALLHSYRVARSRNDGLLLRFGALDVTSLRRGMAELVAAADKVR
jgi:GntR family transcriptional regulator/MocR family aminotransferase